MLPRTHIILGFLFALFLFLIIPNITLFSASLVFLASVFIDVDHYLFYVFRKKDLSLKNAYGWFLEKKDFLASLSKKERLKYEFVIYIFHGVEFWLILALLIFVSKIFLFILIGVLFHLFLDLIVLAEHGMPFHSKLSQIYTHKTNKNRKKLE